MKYHDFQTAASDWQADRPHLEERGVYFDGAASYLPEGVRANYALAMDAQPSLATNPNSAVPATLTTFIDPDVLEILFSPNKAAVIFGEKRKGTWVDDTAMFPVVEQVGEVSSYGDFNNNGHAGANTNWPQRQSYLFQTFEQYGEREIERMGLGRINWVAEQDKAAANVLNRFTNVTYFFGVEGLQNYGLLNDPNLSAALTPATKAAGGVKWINNGQIVATANEVYADIQALFLQLVSQTAGLVDKEARMTLAMSPDSAVALTATNSFGVNVEDLLKKNFPNMKVETAVQYGVTSSSNPNGVVAGNEVQLIVHNIEGQDTGYCAFNEKLRSHPIIREASSWKKKMTAGSWGSIIRMPVSIASLVGV